MRDEHGGAVVALEGALERLHRVDVQVVGGLVQHQAVGAAAHQQQQLEAGALAARQLLDRLAHLLVGEQEAHQRVHGLALGAGALEAHGLDRGGGAEGGVVLLDERPQLDRGADPALAGGRRELTGDEAGEHTLAGAVGAYDADPLAAHDRQRDIEQDRFVVVCGVHVPQLDDALAAAALAAQLQAHLAALEHRSVDSVHAVDLALLHARGHDEALVVALVEPLLEAADHLLQPRDLLLLGLVLVLLLLHRQLAGDGVGGVVAGPERDGAAVQLGDGGDGLVQQVAVMADHHHGTVEAAHQALEVAAALGIEVRLGLVQQQHIRVLGEAGGQGHQLALAAGEHVRGLIELLRPQAELEQQRLDAALEDVPAGSVELVQQAFLTPENAAHQVEVGDHVGLAETVGAVGQLSLDPRDLGLGPAHDLHHVVTGFSQRG